MEWNTDIHITPVPHVHPSVVHTSVVHTSVVHPGFWTGWQIPIRKAFNLIVYNSKIIKCQKDNKCET